MANKINLPIEGACTCKYVRYRLEAAPMFVNCCHCTWCQRESGSAFALNAMLESDRLTLISGKVEKIHTPTNSGAGQQIFRCPQCWIALWSHYAGAGSLISFVRVGTLDAPQLFPPDIHIFTASKQPWIILPADVPAVPEYYDRKQYWSENSINRRDELLKKKSSTNYVK
jgi:hypothetical protein